MASVSSDTRDTADTADRLSPEPEPTQDPGQSEKSSLEELFIAPVKSSLNESKNSKSIEFLDGSFNTTSRVNGIDLEENFSNVKKDKVSRMLSGQIDKEILKGFESKLSSSARTTPSANSHKVLWDGLTDFQRIRKEEIEEQEKRQQVQIERERKKSAKMATVVPPKKQFPTETKVTDHTDLIPAGLGKTSMTAVEPSYTLVGESLRHSTPHEVQCSMFCGGRRCKYESSSAWSEAEMALKGIYSHWITEDILAMSRPNTAQIESMELIKQFRASGIKSIINLQMPGEHASCGPKLQPSGFTYDPNDFMKQKIYHYNFAWKDFGDTSMTNLLDMVKVLSFALKEGKVAVHCHAGLGRTGVLIACYLVYYLRVQSNDAIRYVRLKRPNAVQTRRQIACVKEFETYFLPQCIIFSMKPPSERDKKLGRFTLDVCLKRQKFLVHGFEAKTLKHIPKLLYVICERLVRLCDNNNNVYDVTETNFVRNFLVHKWSHGGQLSRLNSAFSGSLDSTPSDSMVVTRRSSQSMMNMEETLTETTTPGDSRPQSETNSLIQSCSSALSGVDDKRLDDILGDGIRNQNLRENQVTQELASHNDLQLAAHKERLPLYPAEEVFAALVQVNPSRKAGAVLTSNEEDLVNSLKQYQMDLNYKTSAWDKLETETNLSVLSALLMDWLEHLKVPIIDKDSITYLVIHCGNLEKAFKRLPTAQGYVVEYLVRFVARLQPLTRTQVEIVLKRLLAALAHQTVPLEGLNLPIGKNFPKLRAGTMSSCLSFMMNLYDAIVVADNLQAAELSKTQKMRQIIGKIQNSNLHGNDNSIQEIE